MNVKTVPLKSDLVNWAAHYKIERPINQENRNSYIHAYSSEKATYSTRKTGVSKLDDILEHSFGQILFLHQLQHIYCELFDVPVELSNKDFVDYFFANTQSSTESEFKERMLAKYKLSIEDCVVFAKQFTKHSFNVLPSYAECVKEVELIIESNFKFRPFT
jgi:hypothetical protein